MRRWRTMVAWLAGGIIAGGLFFCADAPAAVDVNKQYEDARDRTQRAWDRLQEPELKPEEAKKLCVEAVKDFRFALSHVPRGTKLDDVNAMRGRLSYLYWASDRYHEAAVLGAFLARVYPDNPEAQQGARIALAAYAKLYGDAANDADRKFAGDRMNRIARLITETWPQNPAANDAWSMRIRTALAERNMNQALEYLSHVSSDWPRRDELELAIGQALWAAYLDALRLPEKKRPTKAELAKMLSQARTILESGVQQSRNTAEGSGEVSYALAAAVLALAQIAMEDGHADKAVEWLDDAKIGPLTLIKKKNPIVQRGNFRLEALKAALRAYLATRQLEKAQETIIALEKTNDAANLTRIYLSLGRQLGESLKRARDNGNQAEVDRLSRDVAAFLDRLAARPAKETGLAVMNWVAEMYVSLGENAGADHGKSSATSQDNYQKAAAAYRAILDAAKADKNYATPSMISGVQIRLAKCLRQSGQYREAMDVLAAILQENNNLLDVQREAAHVYQAWGLHDARYYLLAIHGDRKINQKDAPPAHLIWGWGQLARRVQSSEAHQDLFHEARYNLALCRFRYARSKSGAEQTEQLEQAQRDIVIVYKLYPTMGGKDRYEKYDRLLKRIQKYLGVKEDGLRGLEPNVSERK